MKNIDWSKVTENEEVKNLLLKRIEIENQIMKIEKNAIILFELQCV